MENNKTYNYGMLSVTKLIAAILVVMIHTMAFSSLSKDLWVATSLGICRVAVPFFFIISGYFFYNLKHEC
ncbi:acyltransferase family protein [Clostridium sp.]|uniref:acyltransferase family protein n=1 Tax=Clostridium sp. TaxID=1506 RepID=UPI00399251EF